MPWKQLEMFPHGRIYFVKTATSFIQSADDRGPTACGEGAAVSLQALQSCHSSTVEAVLWKRSVFYKLKPYKSFQKVSIITSWRCQNFFLCLYLYLCLAQISLVHTSVLFLVYSCLFIPISQLRYVSSSYQTCVFPCLLINLPVSVYSSSAPPGPLTPLPQPAFLGSFLSCSHLLLMQ